MATEGTGDEPPVRARRVPREDARPQTVLERQRTLSGYLIRRAQRRRDRFLLRSRTTTLREELYRALFLAGCIVFDLLVIPEALSLLPVPFGWAVTAVALVAAVWIQGQYYVERFALGSRPPSGR